jgi:osmoprotectant transport system permease protein
VRHTAGALGLLFLLFLYLAPRVSGDAAFLWPSLIALVVLAIPPILSGAYAGVESVDPAARDAARGMGMTGPGVLLRVELPCSLPLLFSGLRSAALQIIATATIAAIVGLGGLGRFLIDGQKSHDFPQMGAGALVVAVLALLVDFLFALVQRYAVSPGLTGRGTDRVSLENRVAAGRAAGETEPQQQLTDQGAGT